MENLDLTNKVQLRRYFRRLRMDISAIDRQQWSRQIANRVISLKEFAPAGIIFSYLSNWGEVETDMIIREAVRQGKTVLTPLPDQKALPDAGFFHVCGVTENEIFTEKYPGDLTAGDLDLILVPGIVWDRCGHRVGFGGGYFDRLLAGKKPEGIAVGLSYDLQTVKAVPKEPWDQQVNYLVTQSSVIRCVSR